MLKDLETTLPLQKIQIMFHSSISYEPKKEAIAPRVGDECKNDEFSVGVGGSPLKVLHHL